MRRAPIDVTSLAVIALAAATGCHPPLYPRAETVTEAPGGMWIAGGDGLAAFSDGTKVERHDYPTRGQPDWAYGTTSFPGARVVTIRDEAWLFTEWAAVMRWTGAGWDRIDVSWPWGRDTHQLDFAALAPGGSVLVQFLGWTLAWSEGGAPGARWASESTAPQDYIWLGFLDGALFGIGWLNQGPTRTLARRAGKERWEVVGVLGSPTEVGEPLGAVRIPGGPLAAVTKRGLLVFEAGREPRFVPAASLYAGEHPSAPPKPLRVAGPAAPRDAAAPPGPVAAPAPAQGPAQPIPLERRAPELHVAVAPRAAPERFWVDAVLHASGHDPMILLGGDVTAVVEIGERAVSMIQCTSSHPNLIGAATTPAGLRLVAKDAAVYELGPDDCKIVTSGLVDLDAWRYW